MSNPRLSIVVIGRNEGKRLSRCLASIAKMDWPEDAFEVIYIDSHSTDNSLEIARSFGAAAFALETSRPTAGAARNAGWRRAQGELILFLDGDTVLDAAFARRAALYLQEARIAVVWGHRRELFPRASIYQRALDLDWIYPPGPSEFCGGDALVRREALEAADGFDESLIAGEEPELCARLRALGWQIFHADLPMTGHDLAIHSFGQYWRRATRAGYAYSEIAGRFARSSDPFWGRETIRHRNRACLLSGAVVAAAALGLAQRSFLPLVLTAAGFALLVARSAWRARAKSNDTTTLLLYALHSHIQHLPIFVGQMQQRRDGQRNRKRTLIEYKAAA